MPLDPSARKLFAIVAAGALFAAAIDGIVNRYAHVPSTIPLNPEVVALVRQPGDSRLKQAVNDHLERFNQLIGSVAIFVMDEKGMTLASSNWNQPDSFVGEDLSFRPYFQEARRGVSSRYCAVGTTRGEPGYFVSFPIWHEGQVVGVTVIKIGLKLLLEQNAGPDRGRQRGRHSIVGFKLAPHRACAAERGAIGGDRPDAAI